MSEKQVLILIHGMGKHTAESFKEEVVTAANNALGRYPSYTNVKFEQQVHIHSIGYDHIFETLREKMAESGSTLKEFIVDELGGVNLPDFIDDLAGIQADLADEEFFNTHVVDVILYLTLLGERVRLYVAEKLVEFIQEHQETTRINILTHSLGTAVMHDTLNKLYSEGFGDGIGLNKETQPIDTLWTFANVSEIITTLSGLTKPLESVVKPGTGGCVAAFYNIFHRFDIFTLKQINRFDPKKSDDWVSAFIYDNAYGRYKTEKVSRINTHSIESYIEDPLVCHDFLNTLFDFNPSEEEKVKGDDAYKNIQEEFDKIKAFAESVDSFDDLKGLVQLMKAYKDYLGDLDF